jgi:hypothetical protein
MGGDSIIDGAGGGATGARAGVSAGRTDGGGVAQPANTPMAANAQNIAREFIRHPPS